MPWNWPRQPPPKPKLVCWVCKRAVTFDRVCAWVFGDAPICDQCWEGEPDDEHRR
jgi:hypothetical protein